jgi:aminopeptidase N
MLCLVLPACGNGESPLTVSLDPEMWLLRDDLPRPESVGQALRVRGIQGRYSLPPFDRDLRGGPAPPGVTRTAVTLVLDPAARSLTGSAQIDLLAEGAELASVRFLLSAPVDDVQATDPAASFSQEGGVLTVTAQTPVPQGQSWTITVLWHDADVEHMIDFYPDEEGGELLLAYLGEPSTYFATDYWYWPRALDVDMLSNLEFAVTYPDDLTLVMSGEHVNTTDNGDGTATDNWTASFPLPWYLALALADYQMASGTCGTTVLEVYGMPVQTGNPIVPETYAQVLESVCNHYRARFGDPAFPVIRTAGVDDRFATGYSSPALLLVTNYTLDDKGTGSFPARDFYLSHEFSHQWWGNDVFVASMVDVWLVEGMADYSAIEYIRGAWGEEEARKLWLEDAWYLLDYLQQGGADHPLVPATPVEMEPIIYYSKGAWVLRMLEWVLGGQDINLTLRSYREAHPFSYAVTQDFIDAAEAAAGEDLDWFFSQWLSGTGIMSLQETHRKVSDVVDVTISQKSPWLSDPESFFQMPLIVRLERGKKSVDHPVTITGAESTFRLEMP